MMRAPRYRLKERREFWSAIVEALERDPMALPEIIQGLIKKAKQGRRWAIKILAERLDGLPVQQVQVTTLDVTARLAALTDAELEALVKKRLTELKGAAQDALPSVTDSASGAQP